MTSATAGAAVAKPAAKPGDLTAGPAIPAGTIAAKGTPSAPEVTPKSDAATAEATAPEAPAPEEEAAPAAPKSPMQLACEKSRGTWRDTGGKGIKSCVFSTRDGGKSCRRESDCDGACLARSGTCAPLKPLFGCNDILQADGRQVTLCID
ncbi:hypothetical protein [Gemmobacter serpentinus]|uniref:hypothetical protein n=1 Tax=Gemmobacter serpentinus TaxID=2652247 RepID=UPI00124C9621|nr:hypothetical protein [Gemmobacter serpentinus]